MKKYIAPIFNIEFGDYDLPEFKATREHKKYELFDEYLTENNIKWDYSKYDGMLVIENSVEIEEYIRLNRIRCDLSDSKSYLLAGGVL